MLYKRGLVDLTIVPVLEEKKVTKVSEANWFSRNCLHVFKHLHSGLYDTVCRGFPNVCILIVSTFAANI